MEPLMVYENSYNLKDYSISIVANSASISVTVYKQSAFKIWKGNFSSQFIEELTTKTGNFKKFQVFVKMLASGLEKTSQSIIIDILTKDELYKIRNEYKATNDDKLLLIMTYLVEFDKVHYPLSLTLFTNSLNFSKSNSQENETLKLELYELRNIKDEKDIMERRLEALISEKDMEIYYLQKEKEELQTEMEKIKVQMDSIIEQLEAQAKITSTKVSKETLENKKNKEKLENELEKYKNENKTLREEAKRDKSRILQLESELKALFNKSRVSRSKSISSSASSLQKSSIGRRDSIEINQKISNLKTLLDRAKE
jgi:coiled-coil domain-containing protein 61